MTAGASQGGSPRAPPGNCGPMILGPRGGGGGRPGNPAAECPAYGVELQCLGAGRAACGGNAACEQEVDNRIAFVIRSMCINRQCTVSSFVGSLTPRVQAMVNNLCPANRR